MPNAANRVRGFTLIELLVVIAIIGMMAGVVIVGVNQARRKSYDAFRKESLHNLQVALELYYDKHGQYPWGVAYSPWGEPGRCPGTQGSSNWSNCDSEHGDQSNSRHGDPMYALLMDGDIPQGLPRDPETLENNGYLGTGYTQSRGFAYCSGSPQGNCPGYESPQTYVLGTNLMHSDYPDTTWGNFTKSP